MLSGINTVRPSMSETSALGAAMAAGCAEGIDVWDITSEDPANIIQDVFIPKITEKGMTYPDFINHS